MAKRFVKYETENPVGVDAEGVLVGGSGGGLTVLKLSEIATLEPGEINAGGMICPVLFVNIQVDKLPNGNYTIANDIEPHSYFGIYDDVHFCAILSDGSKVVEYASGADYKIYSMHHGNLNVRKYLQNTDIEIYIGCFEGYDHIWFRADNENPWEGQYNQYNVTAT